MTPPRRRGGSASKSKGDGPGGWCPKHDRIYYDASGRCPECGTALVPVGEKGIARDDKRDHRTSDQILTGETAGTEALAAFDASSAPEPRNPWVTRGVVAAALVGAFVLGLAFPRTPKDERPGAPGTPVDRTVHVAQDASESGVGIRLDKLIQRGSSFEGDFLFTEGTVDPLAVQGAALEITTENATGQSSSFGLGAVQVETRANGFIVHGELETADERVVRVRLPTLQVGVPGAVFSWHVDISSVWPVPPKDEPRVLRVNQRAVLDKGEVRLTTILAWSNRLEVFFELRGLKAPGYSYDLGDIELGIPGFPGNIQPGQTIGGGGAEQAAADERVARYEGVPPQARKIVIHPTDVVKFLTGPWAWDIP